MPERVGLGVCGAGTIGVRGSLRHYVEEDAQERMFIAAICDPVPGRAKAAAEEFGALAYYESYEDMLGDPRVQAVTLCSPIGLHYQQTMQAIAAGKHVHSNKTITTTKAEADEVIAAMTKAGVKVVASPQRGHGNAVKRTKEIIASGEIGRVYWAEIGAASRGHEHSSYSLSDDVLYNVNPTWYYKRPGGGPMYDMGVYSLHAITGIFGPAKRVTGMSGIGLKERFWKDVRIEVDMDDNTTLLLDFGDSRYCLVYGSNSSTGPTRSGTSSWYISGSEGALTSGRGGLEVWSRQSPDGHRIEQVVNELVNVPARHKGTDNRHVYADTMHLIDCIQYDKEPAVSVEHARHVIEIIELGYKAAETGVTQNLTTDFVLREITDGPVK